MNSETERRDQMFGKLYSLAELEPTILRDQYTPDNIRFLQDLVSDYWTNRTVAADLSVDQFVELILSLRGEEKIWSRKLGAMLIAAEDCAKAGDLKRVAEYFEYYLENCPCLSLISIAKIEEENFLDER